MQAPEASWQHFFIGLQAELEDRLTRFARESPLSALAASAGIGFVLGLTLPKRAQVAAMTPLIGAAVERWIEIFRPQLQATISQLATDIRTRTRRQSAARN